MDLQRLNSALQQLAKQHSSLVSALEGARNFEEKRTDKNPPDKAVAKAIDYYNQQIAQRQTINQNEITKIEQQITKLQEKIDFLRNDMNDAWIVSCTKKKEEKMFSVSEEQFHNNRTINNLEFKIKENEKQQQQIQSRYDKLQATYNEAEEYIINYDKYVRQLHSEMKEQEKIDNALKAKKFLEDSIYISNKHREDHPELYTDEEPIVYHSTDLEEQAQKEDESTYEKCVVCNKIYDMYDKSSVFMNSHSDGDVCDPCHDKRMSNVKEVKKCMKAGCETHCDSEVVKELMKKSRV